MKAKKENRTRDYTPAGGAGRPASLADGGPGAGQGFAVVPRFPRHAARDGDRRRAGAVHEGTPQPHRGGHARDGHLELRNRARPVPAGQPIRCCINRKIPVQDFLPLRYRRGAAQPRPSRSRARSPRPSGRRASPTCLPAGSPSSTRGIARNYAESSGSATEYEALRKRADDLEAQAATAEAGGNADQAEALRDQSRALHADPIIVEMTFNVYRTTKGKVGEPVCAEMQVTNPHTGADYVNIFPIKEYYTNRQLLQPEILAGSMGDLKIEVRCISPTQYLGMSESDLYLLFQLGELRRQLHEGAVRHLASGPGADRHRRVRRHLPELAGRPPDDHRLLLRRPARLRLSWSISPARPCWAAARSSP